MNQEELSKRKERAETETLIISLTDEGFRVYSPATPTNAYVVSGKTEAPKCTCPDFQNHEADPQWRCKHILAVLTQLEKAAARASKQDPHKGEESRAGQQENHQPEKKERKPKNHRNGTSQMLIKRSVSPDGRIDSLSVEFSCPVDRVSAEEIREHAEKTLHLQSEILESFLNGNGKGNGNARTEEDTDGSIPAQMLNVGGMNTRKGWKFFINVKVNGQTSKLFGSLKELSEHITAAGFPSMADHIGQGMGLNLPCRVITRPSQDGRYINIDKVLPIQPLQPQGRAGR